MKEEFVCLSTVKAFGFTDKLIKNLLSEPLLKTNPHYKKAAPMKLWKLKEVETAMETDAFKQEQLLRERRKISARKGVATKVQNTLDEISERVEHITVKRIDLNSLRSRALQDQQDHYDYLAARYGYYDKYTYGADRETVERWMVNYIRHNLTDYDDDLLTLYRKTGKHKAYLLYYGAIMDKIEEVYPELKEECQRQKARKGFCD